MLLLVQVIARFSFRAGAACFARSAQRLRVSGNEHAAAGRRYGFHFRLSTGSTGTVAGHGCSWFVIGHPTARAGRLFSIVGACSMGKVAPVNKDSHARRTSTARPCATQIDAQPKPGPPGTPARPNRPNNQQRSNLGKKMPTDGSLGTTVHLLQRSPAISLRHLDTAICTRQIAAGETAGTYRFRANADRQLLQSLIVPTRELQKLRRLHYRRKARLRQGFVA